MDSARSSHPRRLRTEHVLAALAALLTASASAAQQHSSTSQAPAADVLETFLDEVESLTADFEQEVSNGDERIEQARGELALERPNRFRWRYTAPIEQLIVADGERLWMYDVELEQVTVAPLDGPSTSSPALLLSGDQAVRDSFEVVEGFEREGLSWVRLEPKLPESDFSSVLLGFRDHTPARLEMVDGLGQTTRIEFHDVELNPELDPELFEFTPPDNVDVIGAP